MRSVWARRRDKDIRTGQTSFCAKPTSRCVGLGVSTATRRRPEKWPGRGSRRRRRRDLQGRGICPGGAAVDTPGRGVRLDQSSPTSPGRRWSREPSHPASSHVLSARSCTPLGVQIAAERDIRASAGQQAPRVTESPLCGDPTRSVRLVENRLRQHAWWRGVWSQRRTDLVHVTRAAPSEESHPRVRREPREPREIDDIGPEDGPGVAGSRGWMP